MLWPEVEIFRVALGQITERRAVYDQPPELRELYSAGSTEPLPDEAELEFAAYTFTGIARVKMSTSSMPAVFHVTDGSPVLSFGETTPDAAILFSPALGPSQKNGTPISPGTTYRAEPGDTLVVLPNSSFSLLNVEKQTASVVSLSVNLESGIERDTPVLSYPSGFGVSMVELLRQPLEDAGGSTRLSLGTVRMAADASLRVSPDTRLMVILDSPDELLLSGRDPGCRDATATPTPGDPPSELPSGVSMLCPDAEFGGLLTNVGKAPVTVWVVAVMTVQSNAPQ
jgi:hypothetical protein